MSSKVDHSQRCPPRMAEQSRLNTVARLRPPPTPPSRTRPDPSGLAGRARFGVIRQSAAWPRPSRTAPQRRRRQLRRRARALLATGPDSHAPSKLPETPSAARWARRRLLRHAGLLRRRHLGTRLHARSRRQASVAARAAVAAEAGVEAEVAAAAEPASRTGVAASPTAAVGVEAAAAVTQLRSCVGRRVPGRSVTTVQCTRSRPRGVRG